MEEVVQQKKSNTSKELSDEIQEKIVLRNKLHENILFSERFIYHSKEDIKEIEKYLWRNCTHEWIYLDNGDRNSRIKYNCKHCKLYRHSSMYN